MSSIKTKALIVLIIVSVIAFLKTVVAHPIGIITTLVILNMYVWMRKNKKSGR